MPHSITRPSRTRGQAKAPTVSRVPPARYTVSLDPAIADNVARYARTADTSMSKAIAALMRVGLEGQEIRKREFFKKLKTNLANDDPGEQDQMVEEFRALILGR